MSDPWPWDTASIAKQGRGHYKVILERKRASNFSPGLYTADTSIFYVTAEKIAPVLDSLAALDRKEPG